MRNKCFNLRTLAVAIFSLALLNGCASPEPESNTPQTPEVNFTDEEARILPILFGESHNKKIWPYISK